MGFPPSGTGQLINPSTLSAADKRAIDRRIFGPIPDQEQQYINQYRDRLAVTFDVHVPDDDSARGAYWESDSEDDFHPRDIMPVNLNTSAVREPPPPQARVVDLSWFNFQILFNSRPLAITRAINDDGDKGYVRPTIRGKIVEQDFAMICSHANEVREAALHEDQRVDANGDKIVSWKWLPGDEYDRVRTEFRLNNARDNTLSRIKEGLRTINFTRDNFGTLDHLFMPALRAGHYILYGFAPKQKKLFVVDSFPGDRFHRDFSCNRETMPAFIRFLVPREDREVWDMDIDIMRQQNDLTPTRVVLQRDSYNCGVYVCTNALCLAFGYDMMCYSAREIDQFRKQRKIAEMRNGGFTGIYNYDVFDVPQVPSETPGRIRYNKLMAAQRRGDGVRLPEGIDDSPPGSEESSPASSEDRISEGGNERSLASQGSWNRSDANGGFVNSDDKETFGLDNIDVVAANLPAMKMGPRPVFPTTSQCLWIDNQIDGPRPESIDRPVHPGFDVRHSFLYPFYHVDLDEALKCSREEMIEACKNSPLANWETWCDFPKDFFLDWMLTEMGATMSRIHKGPILPLPVLGDGYKIWLQWRKEVKLGKLQRQL